jgi:CheY-specific phosphatase CheX
MKARVDEQNVIKASAQFWEQMLAMPLKSMPVENLCLRAGHLIGVVALKGVWQGRIEVRMGDGLAYEATAAMMMQALDSVGEADALDATREIANMIAGTIKSSLPRPCSMTVPESAVNREEFCGPASSEDSLLVGFRHKAGDMLVRIWEQECTQDPV